MFPETVGPPGHLPRGPTHTGPRFVDPPNRYLPLLIPPGGERGSETSVRRRIPPSHGPLSLQGFRSDKVLVDEEVGVSWHLI